jgi:hypothetical protein
MNQNNRTQIIIAVLAVIIVGSLAYLYFRPEEKEPLSITDGFTYNMDEWQTDSDVPMDPNNPGEEVAWNISHVQDMTNPSNGIIRFFIDGSQDDGTIWIEQQVSLTPKKEYNGTLLFRFYSETESFNQIAAVVGYIGNSNPETEMDLSVLGAANEVEGWRTYEHNAMFRTDSEGTAWVACGISVRWETEMIYMIDDVSIEFD